MDSVESMEIGECASVDVSTSEPSTAELGPQTQEPDSTTTTYVALQPVQSEPVLASLQPVQSPAQLQPIQAGQVTTTDIAAGCPVQAELRQQCDNEMVLGQSAQKWDYLVYAASASPMASDTASLGSDYSPVPSPSTTQQDVGKCERKHQSSTSKDVKCKQKNTCTMQHDVVKSEVKSCGKSDSSQCKASCSAPFLPPCKVCGDRASGFHYGVNTCEPCKGFFRRSIVKIEHHKEAYKCTMSGKCSLGPGTRHACSYCRYHKCLEVGMSKDAIKTGRYTYEKRTKITQEVKKLEQMEKGYPELEIKEEDSEGIIRELEAYMKRIEMFGSMSVLPVEVYEEFYKETASHFEFGFLCMFHGINTELNVVTSNKGSVHKDDVAKVVDKTFLDDLFQCAKTFKCLKLTEEEVALIRGIVITFRDRCELQEPDRVEQIQWRLINCLRVFNKRRGLNPDLRLCQIFDRLTALRSISEMCRKLDQQKAQWSAIKDHPLVLDVITITVNDDNFVLGNIGLLICIEKRLDSLVYHGEAKSINSHEDRLDYRWTDN
ncbi:hypothetical protein KUTeg_022724, partial [Tegillarca granosa]